MYLLNEIKTEHLILLLGLYSIVFYLELLKWRKVIPIEVIIKDFHWRK